MTTSQLASNVVYTVQNPAIVCPTSSPRTTAYELSTNEPTYPLTVSGVEWRSASTTRVCARFEAILRLHTTHSRDLTCCFVLAHMGSKLGIDTV